MHKNKTFLGRSLLGRCFFAGVRFLLNCRYRVDIIGQAHLTQSGAKLLLPNHQALIDPILLFAHTYRFSPLVPVLTSSFYDIPVVRWIFKSWGAVRVSDLEAGSRNTSVLEQIVSAVKKGLSLQKSIVLYPSGQIACQGYERIINKQSGHKCVETMPADARVIVVRIRGLWGSRWSRGYSGEAPSFFTVLLKSSLLLFSNFFIFMPKRSVSIEYMDLTEELRAVSKEGKQAFNRHLETIYNIYGEEEARLIKYYWFSR